MTIDRKPLRHIVRSDHQPLVFPSTSQVDVSEISERERSAPHTDRVVLVVCRKCGVAFDPTHLQRCWFCDHPLSDEERDHLDRPATDPMRTSGDWEADDSPSPRPARAASA
jgi:hypothetical protein